MKSSALQRREKVAAAHAIAQQVKRVEIVTCEIMMRATQSAVQLGNYPLGWVDVQCAYDSVIDKHSDLDPTMQGMVKHNLERLLGV